MEFDFHFVRLIERYEGLTLSLKGSYNENHVSCIEKGLKRASRCRIQNLYSITSSSQCHWWNLVSQIKQDPKKWHLQHVDLASLEQEFTHFMLQFSLLAKTKLWTLLACRAGTWLWPLRLEPMEKQIRGLYSLFPITMLSWHCEFWHRITQKA